MSLNGAVTLAGVGKRFGNYTALHKIDLDIRPGEFFALLGPSGSGKTTTLRIIAGLETPDSGQVVIDGRNVTHLAPGDRDAAMVFQSYALYPHMTVAENIGFPLRMVKTPRADIERQVRQAAERVRIGHLLDRRPGQFSGGQQQRCALARAIVRAPRLFLLDEPLSNLDAKLRAETRAEIKLLQRKLDVTAVYVTHDQEEAMTLSDRMAIFIEGRIVQLGTPEEVFGRPVSSTVADFLGSPPMNLLPGTLAGNRLTVEGQTLQLPGGVGADPRPVLMGVRPGDITLDPDGWPATVVLAELLGESVIADLLLGQVPLKARFNQTRRFAENEAVRIGIDPSRVHLFDPSGPRIEIA